MTLLAGLCAIVAYALLRTLQLIPSLPCLWRSALGVRCPMCGTTTTVSALLHGDLGRALAVNPLVTTMAFVGAGAVVLSMVRLATGRSPSVSLGRAQSRSIFFVFLGLIALNWAYVLAR